MNGEELFERNDIAQITADVNAFLRSGSAKDHAVVMEKLCLEGSEVTWDQVENLLNVLDALIEKSCSNTSAAVAAEASTAAAASTINSNRNVDKENFSVQLFIVNGLKVIVRQHYSVFNVSEKLTLYQRTFLSYKKNPHNTQLQELITIIFRYFYDSLQLETSFIEDVKHFCETSVEHLQLGLRLFANVIVEMQDYNLVYKSADPGKQKESMQRNNRSHSKQNTSINQSKLNTFYRKKEIAFRQQLLPAIFEIPFQLLNTKREDLLNESDSNYTVLQEVLNLLLHCLTYDYFDQTKVISSDTFEINAGILSLPCREKRQEVGYLNDLRSQEFTSILFDMLIFMLDKHEAISTMCLDIIAQLIRLSVKFFKKEEQKFSQMMFIVDGLCRVIQAHPTFTFNSNSNNHCKLFHRLANCIAKVPIGISFSDGESLQGFWDFVVEVHNLTKISIQRRDLRSLEFYLEFWCSYDYFLGHDGAQRQEQLRELVENILSAFIEDASTYLRCSVTSQSAYEDMVDNHSQVVVLFSKLANTWIDSIEEQLMTSVSEVFNQQADLQTIRFGRRSHESELKAERLYFQLHWGLLLLFNAQSYNIQAELAMTNKHFELNSFDEIKEDIEILCQAFESFGKLFVIVLNLFKGQTNLRLPDFLQSLMLQIVVFLIDTVLAFPNHISFDYLSVLIKFTDQLNLVNHFYLNCIFVFFIDTFANNLSSHSASSFLTVLTSLTSNIHATEEGLQIGSFPFDMQGFIGSQPFKMHIEGSYDALPNGTIRKVYTQLFRVIDQHETYKRKASEADFEKLMVRVSNIESQFQQQETSSPQKPSSIYNSEKRDQEQQQQQESDWISNMHATEGKAQAATVRTSDGEGVGSARNNKSSSKLNSSNGKQKRVKAVSDFMSPFFSVISNRIQLDVQIPISEQKAIFKGVLNQLIGIVLGSSNQTFPAVVQFILTNNIFYSIKQVIRQEHDMNYDEINCALKLLVCLWETRIYLPADLSEVLFKEIIDVLILTQQRMLLKGYVAQISNPSNEWSMLIKPMSYQYRLIFAMLQRQSLDFNHVDAQVVVSNMFYCLRLVSPEKISHYQQKLHSIFLAIHTLSEAHFDVFLLLQPLEFQAVAQLMEESLNSHFESLEPLNFFINIMNQVFLGLSQEVSSIKTQHLSQSQEILERVLQKIVLKVARKEDLNHSKLPMCLLSFYWMMRTEKFMSTVNSVLSNPLHDSVSEKFLKFTDDIEILDGVQYHLASDHVAFVSKDIFTKIFI